MIKFVGEVERLQSSFPVELKNRNDEMNKFWVWCKQNKEVK